MHSVEHKLLEAQTGRHVLLHCLFSCLCLFVCSACCSLNAYSEVVLKRVYDDVPLGVRLLLVEDVSCTHAGAAACMVLLCQLRSSSKAELVQPAASWCCARWGMLSSNYAGGQEAGSLDPAGPAGAAGR